MLVTQLSLFVTPWIIVHKALLSMEFSSINTGVGCLFDLQEIFLTQVPWISHIAGRLFTNRDTREDIKENKLASQSQVLPSISITPIIIKLGVWLKCAWEGGKNINFKLAWNWKFKSGLTRVSCIVGGFFINWVIREALDFS